MTKIFNNRPLFYCFLAFGLGIYFAKPIFSFDVPVLIYVAIALAVITFLCIKYKHIYRLLLILACFLIGIGSFFISMASFNGKDYGDSEYEICGRVCESTIYDSSQSLILDNVYVNGDRISENISVFIYDLNELEEGNVITFTSTLTKQNLFTLGKFNNYSYKYNVVYSCSINSKDLTINALSELTWAERLKFAVKGVLFNNMNKDEASVGYASLFGDKTYIPTDTRDNFSVTGIAHLLAVSGLHVGFVVSIVSYLLNKMKVKGVPRICTMAVFLAIYCYLCSFSSSVVRASIMFLIMGISQIFGRQYDRLNSLSLAGIICLLYRPLSVYDIGFLLTFACAFCIFMFAKPMENFLIKKRIPKPLAGALAVTIPVELGLLPLLANCFSKVSLLSVITNIICIPIFEMFFTLLFIFVPIVLIAPALKFVLALPEFIISIIMNFSNSVAQINWAIIQLTSILSLCVISFYVILFISSHFIGAKHKTKVISCCCILFVSLLICVPVSTKVSPSNGRISVLNVYQNPIYSIEVDGVSFIAGAFNKQSIKRAEALAEYSRLYNYDYYISLNSSLPENKAGVFSNVYTCMNYDSDCYLEPNEEIVLGDVKVVSIHIGNKFAGLIINGKSSKIFICANETLNQGNYLEFALTYGDFDIIMGKEKYINPYLDYVNYNYLINSGQSIADKLGQKVYNYNGNWTFNLTNSKIYNIRGVD